MRFKGCLFVIFVVIFGGLIVINGGGTAGSACRDAGRAIRGLAIDEDGSGSLAGLRAWISGAGRSIEDTCSRR